MGVQSVRMRHHIGGKVQRELTDARRNLARWLLEEAGRTAGGPARPELLQPFRLDIERQDQGSRPVDIMHISVRLPAVDKHGRRIRERIDPVAHQELRVGALDLEQDMAVVVGVTDQRTVHVEQSHPAESTMSDAQGRRHQYLPSTN